MSQNLDGAKISIIIPVLNEAENIRQAIACTQLSTNIEVIVVDGGSQDDTNKIASDLKVTIISSLPGRAVQMNKGATLAKGDILLFLHADTRLPTGFDVMIRTALQPTGTVAGAFALRIDAEMVSLRLVEWGVNMRSRFWQMPYGDQAIFLTKQTFNKIGNFPELPFMEDFEIMRRLKRIGRITIIPVPVITSARRWLQKGIWKTTLINQIIIIAYLLGIPPQRLIRWYRQKKFRKI
ncbi:TIGR04283 family arsenosugar biosynthesis glycosyltransferase [Scytonema hofmannii FACHB-248]|uniref:4,4'-diaponeurosporenoate glycosyltransferase n=1 Tax=Scytonema hofmannii FACHB-248 TaxID=1842502 RepID=A0ABR8GM13_9CYAN|nr:MULTISPECIES: TIGR04283 family arsenosugar biosynthesis glycosyltransferase [Nostocales]MBD2604452.1 TIGR04283 family arsenosugar biosynthesis glycosyltransferase [Scytonema hofmannii FACHB-248]